MQQEQTKVVVITGASSGVGRATAREFARRGASIALIARGEEKLQATRGEVEQLGARALVVTADVADAGQVEQAVETVESTLGPIDIWINSAMVTVFSPLRNMQPEEFARVTEVTYLGAVWGTMAVLKRMRQRNRGVIVQVSSALAYRAIPLQSAYCGAKHALRGFTTALRSELGHERSAVHITMVHLPAVNTPQFGWGRSHLPKQPQPVPPIYQPEVAARAVYWAAHHRRRDLFVGFSSLRAVWANRLLPGLTDWYLARKGFAAQQTDAPSAADRADNLWSPVAADRGAHGQFDRQSRAGSVQLWLSQHRRWVVVACALAGGLALGRQGYKHRRERARPRLKRFGPWGRHFQ